MEKTIEERIHLIEGMVGKLLRSQAAMQLSLGLIKVAVAATPEAKAAAMAAATLESTLQSETEAALSQLAALPGTGWAS